MIVLTKMRKRAQVTDGIMALFDGFWHIIRLVLVGKHGWSHLCFLLTCDKSFSFIFNPGV